MTIFTTDLFKLDLSHLNIKFSEENSFFEKDLIKQQSFPFKVPRERSFLSFFDFIESHNSTESNKYIKGTLFRNDKFYEAELMVIRISKEIEAVFYYKADNLTIFDKNLRDLPWGTIDVGDSIFDYAKQTIAKDYPQTKVNFPRIYAPDLYKDYDFGSHTGYINEVVGGDFSETLPNSTDPLFPLYKMNEIRPFLYLREILKVIFDEIGYTIAGDLVTDTSLQKCLLYHQTQIFYTNKDFNKKSDFDFLLINSTVITVNNVSITRNTYRQDIVINEYGTYEVTINVKGLVLPIDGSFFRIMGVFNEAELVRRSVYPNVGGENVDFETSVFFSFSVDKNLIGSTLEIYMFCTSSTASSFEGNYVIKGTNRPLYRNEISKSQLLPDMSVGTFVAGVKESFNMTSVFNPANKTVDFNFFKSFIDNPVVFDLSKYSQEFAPRKLNKKIGYKIPFTDGQIIYINKKGGFVQSAIDFKDYEIPIEPLKATYIGGVANVTHQDGVSMLFFKSNINATPLVAEGSVSFSRLGFIHYFLRGWMYQKLNSEEYNLTVDLPLFESSQLNSDSKLWFFNNFFLVHSLRRFNVNGLFEKMTMKLFKLKNLPEFNFVIDDGSGNTTNPPPVIVVTETTNPTGTLPHVNQFYVSSVNLNDGSRPYFIINLYANGSTDSLGLGLTYTWLVLSSPDGNASGVIESLNPDGSTVRFFHVSFSNLTGAYGLRLTVVDTEEQSSSADLTINVS